MKAFDKSYFFLLVLLLLFFSFSFVSRQNPPWVAPEKYKSIENPVEEGDEIWIVGKSLYNKHCKRCHGTTGKGDGKAAGDLGSKVADLTSRKVQDQKDGELFYKITTGRNEMPNYSKAMEVEDVWVIVHYLRSLE